MKIIIMLFAVCLLTLASCLARYAKEVCELTRRVETAERALSGVKPVLDGWANISNEVRDMRETMDALPLEEIQAAADYDKALMDGLENIANYSLSEAMKRTGDTG
jgi:hypothetical protein